jgi:hypothetical protein
MTNNDNWLGATKPSKEGAVPIRFAQSQETTGLR